MSKGATKKFVENNGFICNNCGKIILDGHKHKNEEDLCDQCKIADLEAKLAESEKALEAKESVNQIYKATLSLKDSDFSDLVRENTKLKQQLAEKEKEIEKWKTKWCESEKNSLRLYEQNQNKDQDKISFAVEQLEKARELLFTAPYEFDSEEWCWVEHQISNQIADLTHQHEDKGE